MSTKPAQMVKLVDATQGMPYLRSLHDANGNEVFLSMIRSAVTSANGLTAWWAERDKIVSLWYNFFGPLVGDSTLNLDGKLTPIIQGYLNGDTSQVAYSFANGDTMAEIAWYKKTYLPNLAANTGSGTSSGGGGGSGTSSGSGSGSGSGTNSLSLVGMPGISVTSGKATGLQRFAGFLPKVGDIGAEVYSGSLLWGALAGPLARNMTSQLVTLGKNWWQGLGTSKDTNTALDAAVSSNTKETTDAQGETNSASNLDETLGGNGSPGLEGGSADAGPFAQKVMKDENGKGGVWMASDDAGAEVAAPFLQGVEFTPGLIGLVGVALFAYLPIYFRGKRMHIDLRLEVVNATSTDLAWEYTTLNGGSATQVPNATTIPATAPFVDGNFASAASNISHAGDFSLTNDSEGKNPLEAVLDLTLGSTVFTVAIKITTKNKVTTCASWCGTRAPGASDADLIKNCVVASSTANAGGMSASCNIALDDRSNLPADQSTSNVVQVSGAILIEPAT